MMKIKSDHNHYRRKTGGFALLEVLVAVAVLAIGLLGLAGLQVSGLRFNHSAYLRTQATLLAYELADRMRANPTAWKAGNYDVNNVGPLTVVAACRAAAGCSPAQMAQNDIAEWQGALARLLPRGQGVVCRDTIPVAGSPGTASCRGGTTYSIQTWWDDNRNGSADQRFVITLTQ